jgi:hypothetical protein
LLVWWLIAVAGVIVLGKNGIMAVAMSRNKQEAEPLGITLEICPACHDSSADADDQLTATANRCFVNNAASTQQNGRDEEEQQEHQIDIMPQEEESRRLLFDESGGSSDSSSSTSNSNRRPFRRNASKKD